MPQQIRGQGGHLFSNQLVEDVEIMLLIKFG